MTLVLSMNPFLDPEGDPPLSTYKPIWESERCTKACLSAAAPPCSSEGPFAHEAPCRRVPDHVSVSKISYFKRKFVEDEEPPLSFRTYCQTVGHAAVAAETTNHRALLTRCPRPLPSPPSRWLRSWRSVLTCSASPWRR